MKKSFISMAAMFALGSMFFSCQTNIKEANYNVIPAPLEIIQGQEAGFVLTDGTKIFYPEGNAETRFQLRGGGFIYIYCNKHGLMRQRISRR